MFNIFKRKQLPDSANWEEQIFMDYYRKNLKGITCYYVGVTYDRASYRLSNQQLAVPIVLLKHIKINSVEFNDFINSEFIPAFETVFTTRQQEAIQEYEETLNPYV